MMANEAITDLSSKAFRKLPAIEKCLKAKYPAMANETITPVWVPLFMKIYVIE